MEFNKWWEENAEDCSCLDDCGDLAERAFNAGQSDLLSKVERLEGERDEAQGRIAQLEETLERLCERTRNLTGGALGHVSCLVRNIPGFDPIASASRVKESISELVKHIELAETALATPSAASEVLRAAVQWYVKESADDEPLDQVDRALFEAVRKYEESK